MHKVLLIIKREYLTRVRKKSFIVMTILGPLLFAGLLIVPILLARMEGDEKVIEVLDESGLFEQEFNAIGSLRFEYIDGTVQDAKMRIPDGSKYGLLYIPPIDIEHPSGIVFFSENNPSLEIINGIENAIRQKLEAIKLRRSGIDKATLDNLKTRVQINTVNLNAEGEKEGHAGVASAIGYFSSFLIYIFIFVYGAQVMRGVIEEKSNRIIEIIISSVKPFQLMLGKILGIAGVVLTQFVLWIVLTFGVSALFGGGMQQGPMIGNMQSEVQNLPAGDVEVFMNALGNVDFTIIVIAFGFYFLAGYLLYASMFAAVGSAIDNDADSQQFVFPITIPLILSIVVLSAVINDPDSSLAFWMSIIPFTSPVVMMMRVPFGVPAWELVLSMTLLTLGFMFTTWLASRIYRIGILMHGTKVSYRVLWKWLTMKY